MINPGLGLAADFALKTFSAMNAGNFGTGDRHI